MINSDLLRLWNIHQLGFDIKKSIIELEREVVYD